MSGARSFDETAIANAWEDLRATMSSARAELDRLRSQPLLTPDERRRLQQDALDGTLGRDMQRLAQLVESGETSWPEVFEGSSPYAGLAAGHLDRMIATHADAVREQLRADPDFDMHEGHDSVERAGG